MSLASWTPADSEKAKRVWAEYQLAQDVSARKGQAVGIDPASGKIWFGESSLAIRLQQEAVGECVPLYFLRVGRDHYGRKGGRR